MLAFMIVCTGVDVNKVIVVWLLMGLRVLLGKPSLRFLRCAAAVRESKESSELIN